MKRKRLDINDDMALVWLSGGVGSQGPEIPYSHWIRTVRIYLRMTQSELAGRAKITQSHLACVQAAGCRLFSALRSETPG